MQQPHNLAQIHRNYPVVRGPIGDAGYNEGMRVVYLTVAAVTLALIALAAQPAKKASAPAPSKAAMAVTMPPIPALGYSPGRPVDVTRAVYKFAAEHPEILKYVPCYCGCENSGHPHNESCFVKRRDAKGNVTEWDTHGYG